MASARKRKTDRRAAPACLSPEDRRIFTLGRNAERFIAADKRAREIRHGRNHLLETVHSTHFDDTPCYEIGAKDRLDWDEGEEDETAEEPLPVSEWCEDCRRYAKAHNEAAFVSWERRSARQSLTAAYRRLLRFRQDT